MNYHDCFLTWNDIEHFINNKYDSHFGNKQLSQLASSSRPKSSLLSSLLSASKRSRSSLNELHYYSTCVITPEIDADSRFEHFNILAW